MNWQDVPGVMDDWADKTAAPAWDLRQATAEVFTRGPVDLYWHPERSVAALYGFGEATPSDTARIKMAAVRAVGASQVQSEALSWNDLAAGGWVKAAVSPLLRQLGMGLNFFKGQYPGGIPNAPSPLAATLTGGLVGAGLGYGAGWLGEKILPDKWEKGKLRRSLALLGGAAGALPGAGWGISSLLRGRSLLDPSDLNPEPGAPILTGDMEVSASLAPEYVSAVDSFVKQAYGTFAFERVPQPVPGPMAINVNRLGQVLWETGADPKTSAVTLGAMYAASHFPDPNAEPGEVTPHQTGLLGTMLGAAGGGLEGYIVGNIVGKTLGLLTGMPQSTQNTLQNSGALLGAINAVVPRLFH